MPLFDNINNKFLTTGIHTCEVIAVPPDNIEDLKALDGVSGVYTRLDKNGELTARFKFNPNHYYHSWVTSPALFETVLAEAMNSVGIHTYKINRLDIPFDFYDSNDFDKFAKLNRLLLSLLSICGNMPDRYQSDDYFTLESLNIKAKSNRREAEAYNKQADANLKGYDTSVECRLEFRSKSLKNSKTVHTYSSVINEWFKLLDKSVTAKNIQRVEDDINKRLTDYYRANISKFMSRNGKPDSRHTRNKFAQTMQSYIYSKHQLIELYRLLGESEPERCATIFKGNYRIEYFTTGKVLQYVKLLKRTARKFVNTNENAAINNLIS